MLKRLCVLVLALALAACEGGPMAPDRVVQAAPEPPATLVLTNTSGRTVHYMMFDRHRLALMKWAPCSPRTCPAIEPGETVRVPYSEVAGYDHATTEVWLAWWMFAEGADGEHRAVRAGSRVVRL